MYRFPIEFRLVKAVSLARAILKKEGEIRLGALFAALQSNSTKVKYGSFVDKHRPVFKGMSKDEFFSLYELTLLELEVVEGPLSCRRQFDPSSFLKWGYSRKYRDGEEPSPPHNFSRFVALQGAHPDAPYFSAGMMPDTIWSKRSDLLKRAA